MKRILTPLARTLCSAGVLAMALGALHLSAEPASARPYCNPTQCSLSCGGYGFCNATYGCLCY